MGQLTQQNRGPGTRQVHHGITAHEAVVRGKLDGQVVVQAAGESPLRTAIALDQNPDGQPDLCFRTNAIAISSCTASRRLIRSVFSLRGVGSSISAAFVPVRLE